VLLTYFPGRALEGMWPWYGQALGWVAYTVSRLFVSGVGYIGALNPTLTGSQLSVTILKSCSGISGIELFDYLFSVVIIVDWNRLHKGRALAGYFAGVAAMLLGNVLRISSFVVLGNHGLAEQISHYHISAGWIFFTAVFLIYLSVAYSWMLHKREDAEPGPQAT
jgi:exosortase/archaeosortase family protein